METALLDRRLARIIAVTIAFSAGAAAQRVVLVSFDGLGYETLTKDVAARELTTFTRVRSEGATFNGVQPHFPSTTANSHAAIWTGAYGDVNGITFNWHPLLPRASHAFSETESGFRSTQLAAEPIWVTAARQGKKAVAHQATQMYPFTEANTHKGAVAVNGYQTRTFAPYQLIARAESWESGTFRFHATKIETGLRVCVDKGGCVEVSRAGGFSAPLMLPGELPLATHYRLFGDRLLQTHIQELALHDGDKRNDSVVREMVAAEGAFLPNGADRLLTAGELSPAEYLETVEFQIRQTVRHARWLNARYKPDLMISYLPFPDETDHKWIALDRAGDASAREYRVRVFRALNAAATEYQSFARPSDTLILTSDHGMTPYRKTLNLRAVLESAGLSAAVKPLYYSVLVNAGEWMNGGKESRESLVQKTREALATVRDPDTGEKVVTAFFTPAEHGARFGIGGPASGDLYFDVLPGYSAGELDSKDLVVERRPQGTHGFLPTRDDMLAICIARGPRFRANSELPRIRSIQIAPMISQILGIGSPRDARGQSPLD